MAYFLLSIADVLRVRVRLAAVAGWTEAAGPAALVAGIGAVVTHCLGGFFQTLLTPAKNK